MDLSLSPEQRELSKVATNLANVHGSGVPTSWEEAGEFPWSFVEVLAHHGLTGIAIPTEVGGQGASLLDAIIVIESVARHAPHLADGVQATNFGAVRQIAQFAGPRLIDDVLRPLLAGTALATVAMSEPDAGSALGSLRTTARRDGAFCVVNGTKMFNSNGPHATHYVVWARFGDGRDDIGAVVVPADTAGFSRGTPERFISGEQFCELSFVDCRVPEEYVLLERDGMREMMRVFNIERLGNATRSYGYGLFALDRAISYARERHVGGQPIGAYQGIRWKIADIKMRLDAAQLLVFRAASELVDGAPAPLHTSIAKCVANEAGFFAANEALQIFGGYGYSAGSLLDYVFRRTRGWMIAGGSVEIQRNRIAQELLGRLGE